MPLLRNNLLSPNDSLESDIANLQEMTFSNNTVPTEKSSTSLTEKTGYQDSVYLNAANIFQHIHNEKPRDKLMVKYGNGSLPSAPDFKDERCQRLSYELAFNALKYQDILENILIDSGIYPMQSIPDELTSLAVVMLYDLQDRKFEARQNINDNAKPITEVQEVEHYLYSFKTKLAAALARCRIKHDALSIDCILPETIRKQEQRASALPLFAWVNTLKVSLEEVHSTLEKEGFIRVESVSTFDGYTYCLDTHCEDLLIFPSALKEQLLNLELFIDYKLLLQDKSRSLAVHSVKSLLNMDDDILIAHVGSGLTVAHMSVLNQGNSKVFVCGVKSVIKEAELKNLFTKMECKNIELLHEDFTDIEPTDHKLQKVKVILLLPRCSGLGVSNPIEFILNEHEDADLLRDLSQGSVAEDKLNILAQQQLKELTHAMHFSRTQAVVYCTCSVYPDENEAVVNKALTSGAEGAKAQPYKLCPPVLPLCCKSEINTSENFFKLELSDISNSCFIAVLARERDPSETVSVKDVLARAAAKGLLEGIDLAKPPKKEEKKKKQKVIPAKTSTKETVLQSRIQEFLDREMKPDKIDSDSSVSIVTASTSQKAINQKNDSMQLKKTAKPLSNSSLPVMLKNTPTSSSTQKVFERQRTVRKPKSEDRMVLKPVEIVLPPVMMPYFNPSSQRNKPHLSSNHYYYHHWVGTKSGIYGSLSPSSSKKLTKPKDSVAPSAAKHARPLL